MAKPTEADWIRENESIIANLDVRAEYIALGLEVIGQPNPSGWCRARAYGRPDRNPSAAINVLTGRYKDHGDPAANGLSLWDFATEKAKQFATWKEARKFYALKANVTTSWERPLKRELSKLRWIEWNDDVVAMVDDWGKQHKRPITAAAVRYAGGKVARYSVTRNAQPELVVAIPVYDGHALTDGDPIGFQLYRMDGHDFEVRNHDMVQRIKVKSVGRTAGGLMGNVDLSRLMADKEERLIPVIKTAGPTDMLALLSTLLAYDPTEPDIGPPDSSKSESIKLAIIANASGENGLIDRFVDLMNGRHLTVIHDADLCGKAGILRWYGAKLDPPPLLVKLPYELAPNHGADLRDLINELVDKGMSLADAWVEVKGYIQNPDNHYTDDELSPRDASQAATPLGDALRLTAAVGLEVLGTSDDGIVIYSNATRRTRTYRTLCGVGIEDFRSLAGESYAGVPRISANGVPGHPEHREALALISAHAPHCEPAGIGIWPDGPDLLAVASRRFLHVPYDPSGEVRELTVPRGNHTFAATRPGHDWLTDNIVDYVTNWTPYDEVVAYKQVIDHFNVFRWVHPSLSHVFASVCMLAVLQKLVRFRPQVAISGTTGAGKSTISRAIHTLFTGLSSKQSSPSEGGVKAETKRHSFITVLDELESDGYRYQSVLDLIRAASSGDRVVRSDSHQNVHAFEIKHLFFCLGISLQMEKEADSNRFIRLELEQKDGGVDPNEDVTRLRQTGERLIGLAIRLWRGGRLDAVREAVTQVVVGEGVSSGRRRELVMTCSCPHEAIRSTFLSLSSPSPHNPFVGDIPASLTNFFSQNTRDYILDIARGQGLEIQSDIGEGDDDRELVQSPDGITYPHFHDKYSSELTVLYDVLRSQVRKRDSELTVWDIVKSFRKLDELYDIEETLLFRWLFSVGITVELSDVLPDASTLLRPEHPGVGWLLLNKARVKQLLLDNRRRSAALTYKILQRLPGAKACRLRILGERPWFLAIPMWIADEAMSREANE